MYILIILFIILIIFLTIFIYSSFVLAKKEDDIATFK